MPTEKYTNRSQITGGKNLGGSIRYLLSWHCMAPLVLFEGSITANQYIVLLNDYLYPVMIHFCPDGCSLFQDDHTTPYTGYKGSVNSFIPFEHFWSNVLDSTITETQTEGISFGKRVRITLVQFLPWASLLWYYVHHQFKDQNTCKTEIWKWSSENEHVNVTVNSCLGDLLESVATPEKQGSTNF